MAAQVTIWALSVLLLTAYALPRMDANYLKPRNLILYIACTAGTTFALMHWLHQYAGITVNTADEYLWYVPLLFHINYLFLETLFPRSGRKKALSSWAKSATCFFLFVVVATDAEDGFICSALSQYTLPQLFVTLMVAALLWSYGKDLLQRSEKARKTIRIAFLTFSPILAFLICEIAYNPYLKHIEMQYIFLNIYICVLLEIFLLLLFPQGIGIYILYAIVTIAGVANYYVISFRGAPIMATDLLALGTAMEVTGDYKYTLPDALVTAILMTLFAVIICSITEQKHPKKKKHIFCIRLAVATILAMCSLQWMTKTDFTDAYEIVADLCWPEGVYRIYGFSSAFVTYWQKSKTEIPEGYSLQETEALLSETSNRSSRAKSSTQRPTIIAIMNESFADLSVMGPFACEPEHLSFLKSLQFDEHTVEYGYQYVSIYGGGTALTEFEFLTGASAAFLAGKQPYTQFHLNETPSLPRLLDAQGYSTVAMHPENPNNWRRNSVYKELGFDTFYSVDDYQDAEKTELGRVTDLADYKKLIEIYEARNEPTFIFNVTMQNHGGYSKDCAKGFEKVTLDPAYKKYTDVKEYETLAHASDEALAYLIRYFEQEEQPVLICFFGDHQPALGTFAEDLSKKGKTSEDTQLSLLEKKYAVPYLIWANFEPAENYRQLSPIFNEVNITSPNYLGRTIMTYCGLKMSAYDDYLLALRKDIPVLNAFGYYGADGKWHDHDENNSYRKRLEAYEYIQYGALFDNDKEPTLYNIKGDD